MTGPLVSIVTPVRNRARFVAQAIDSVLAQTHANVEHIIVDAVSTDGTLEIIREYAAREPERVQFLSEPDGGACDAWNKGWTLARGSIFGWLGADDLLERDAVERVVRFFRDTPQAHFVYGECRIIDADGRVIGRYATTDYDREEYVNAANGIAAMAAFYTRHLVETVGGLDTSINLCDCDYWIRAAEKFRLYRIPDVLASFRYHDASVTRNLQGSVYLEEQFLLNRRYGGGILSPVGRRYARHQLAKIPGASAIFRALAPLAGGDGHFRRVAIFGAALSGRLCCEELAARGVDVAFFIDNAPPPGGCFLDRSVVRLAEARWDEIDAVIIASSGRAEEMRSELARRGCSRPIRIWSPGAAP